MTERGVRAAGAARSVGGGPAFVEPAFGVRLALGEPAHFRRMAFGQALHFGQEGVHRGLPCAPVRGSFGLERAPGACAPTQAFVSGADSLSGRGQKPIMNTLQEAPNG